uniref:Uncharacterized protein n=1 Tax=Magallana gigas TaxID=29159 RepID=K1PWE6_MAGGI
MSKRRVKATSKGDYVWVLVQFDDQVYSIDKLQNLENEGGETGENLDLTEGARCMAEYNKEYYPATVVCMNENKEEVMKKKKEKETKKKSRKRGKPSEDKENVNEKEGLDLDSFGDVNMAGVQAQGAATTRNVEVSPVAVLSPTVPLVPSTTPSRQVFRGAPSTQSRQVFFGDAPSSSAVEHLEAEPTISDVKNAKKSRGRRGPLATSVSSAFRVLQDTCTSCMMLEEQLFHLQRAYEEQAKEISSWRNQCLYLQDALDKSRSPLEMTGNAESVPGLSTQKEHYRPKRGVQIALSGYRILNEGEDVPPDFIRLSSMGKVIVPKIWLHSGVLNVYVQLYKHMHCRLGDGLNTASDSPIDRLPESRNASKYRQGHSYETNIKNKLPNQPIFETLPVIVKAKLPMTKEVVKFYKKGNNSKLDRDFPQLKYATTTSRELLSVLKTIGEQTSEILKIKVGV